MVIGKVTLLCFLLWGSHEANYGQWVVAERLLSGTINSQCGTLSSASPAAPSVSEGSHGGCVEDKHGKKKKDKHDF